VYFAYTDESGDPGYDSSAKTFTVATVIVEDVSWLECLDRINEFRRELRDRYGLNVRDELKANAMIHGYDAFEPFNEVTRKNIYLDCMEFQATLGLLDTFAVVICKERFNSRGTVDPRDYAWEFIIQRFERFANHRDDLIHILPDEGHYEFIKARIRELRRFNRPPSYYDDSYLNRDATNIVGDCSERDSEDSFFIQLADLNAYAAWRSIFPHPDFQREYWEALGVARDARASPDISQRI